MAELDAAGVRVGETLPPFVRTTTPETWHRFAAVNDEFVPVHMDDDAGRRAGNPEGAFGMGNLRLSYVMNLLRGWCGDRGEITSIELRLRELNRKGDVLTAMGTVVVVTDAGDSVLVELDVDVRNQDGASTAPGRATVRLDKEGTS